MTFCPNILWITTDQQRWDTLGCLGNPHVRTPHLDRLAGGGALFPLAFCQSPVCTPSRASFLTGRYPRTTRCRQNGQDIPADEILVTRLLRDAGWRCGLAGKLHLSACDPNYITAGGRTTVLPCGATSSPPSATASPSPPTRCRSAAVASKPG